MLAIIAPSFGVISETFIEQHTRLLAPGNTVLLSSNGCITDPTRPDSADHKAPAGLRRGFLSSARDALKSRVRFYINPKYGMQPAAVVARTLRDHSVCSCLAEFGPTGYSYLKICEIADVPLHTYFHGHDASALPRYTIWRRRYRRLFGSAKTIITPSKYLAARLEEIGCPVGKLRVCPYGVDLGRFSRTSRVPNRLVAVGRLVEKKAPLNTLEAFFKVQKHFPDARLEMIGDGPLMQSCQRFIKERNLSTRVKLHGAKPHRYVQEMMQTASIFVQHSIEAHNGDCEGLPVAILEAMACSLPVVSTFHSGIPEAVSDEETGFLVQEHDVASMANCLIKLLSDPSLGIRMGAAGRLRAENLFDQTIMSGKLSEILGIRPSRAAAP